MVQLGIYSLYIPHEKNPTPTAFQHGLGHVLRAPGLARLQDDAQGIPIGFTEQRGS